MTKGREVDAPELKTKEMPVVQDNGTIVFQGYTYVEAYDYKEFTVYNVDLQTNDIRPIFCILALDRDAKIWHYIPVQKP